MSTEKLNLLIEQGGNIYSSWKHVLFASLGFLQELSDEYSQVTGKPLPDSLDPTVEAQEAVATHFANYEAMVALAQKAGAICQAIEDATEPTDPLTHPGGDVFVPDGENPFVYLIEQAKYDNPKKGDLIPIFLPKGAYKGVDIGGSGWSPIDRIDPWWGEATLLLIAHPEGSTVKPAHDDDGWGATFSVLPRKKNGQLWGGYVEFYDLSFQATGGNVLQLGEYGTQDKVPLKGLVFKRCKFLDHPLDSVTVTRPISANQAAMSFIECVWELPHSQEHAVYSRNPYGDSLMQDCVIDGVGAQVWQEVGRPEEGPFYGYPNGTTTIVGNKFLSYHNDDDRSGSAITLAGSARDLEVRGNFLQDLDESDDVYGAFVAYDGGKYYSIYGDVVPPGSSQSFKKGKYANGRVIVEDNIMVQKNGNRDIFQINSCLHAEVRRNGFYGSKPCDISSDPDAGIGELFWEDNNREEEYEKALALGVPQELLNVPQLRLNGQIIGNVAMSVHVVNDELA